MNQNTPKCTVYMATYNSSGFIRETIESVLQQTYTDFELYITDDCSTDNTVEIINEYIHQYPDKIILRKNSVNRGVGYVSHCCFEEHCTADYAGLIGHDDAWEPEYLEKMIGALQKSDAVAAFGKIEYHDNNGKKINVNIFLHELLDGMNRHEVFLRIMTGNFLCAPSAILNMSRLKKDQICTYWGYNNDRLQDAELWMNLICFGSFIYVPKATCYYRWHQTNLSDINKRIIQAKLEYYQLCRRVLFSEHFHRFMLEADNAEAFVYRILEVLNNNTGYCKMLQVLKVDFCEELLNHGYAFPRCNDLLSAEYMNFGAVSKALKGRSSLPFKIPLFRFSTVDHPLYQELLNRPELFAEVPVNENAISKGICVCMPKDLEMLLTIPAFNSCFSMGWAMIFCEESEAEKLRMTYPLTLVVSCTEVRTSFVNKAISFVEDCTEVFSNGFLQEPPMCSDSMPTVAQLVIQLKKGTSPRWINLMGIKIKDASFFAQDISIKVESEQADNYTLAPYKSDLLVVHSSSPITYSNGLMLDNTYYILDHVAFVEGQLTAIYRDLCFGTVGISNMSAEYQRLKVDYDTLINLRSVKYARAFSNFIHKAHLYNIAKHVDNTLRKWYNIKIRK